MQRRVVDFRSQGLGFGVWVQGVGLREVFGFRAQTPVVHTLEWEPSAGSASACRSRSSPCGHRCGAARKTGGGVRRGFSFQGLRVLRASRAFILRVLRV